MRVGYLVSSFDMLNVGDLDIIRQAQELCAELTVVVLDDDGVTVALGRPPVVPLHERVAIVECVRGITRVTTTAEDTPEIQADAMVLTTEELLDHVAAIWPAAVSVRPGVVTRSTTLMAALQSVVAPTREAVA